MLRINERFDEIKINQAIMFSLLNQGRNSRNIQDYEFRAFSQAGEDGILQYLTRAIDIKEKTFIEFGVEDFFESNCRLLLMKDNWRGFVIDGSPKNIARLKRSYFYWRHDLTAISQFVTRENINGLLAQSGFGEDLGILSIDLDGNDYFILEAIGYFRPRILICEYNAVFGGQRKISVPYDSHFYRTEKHYSNLYFGASLPALTCLANKKGYSLVGTNSLCSNAFFVRNDLLNDKVQVLSAEQAYIPSEVRESRDRKGNFTFLGGNDRLALIKGLPVVNVETGDIEAL